MQAPAPARLYVPGGHRTAVGVALPSGQAYPAVHVPEHTGVVSPLAPPEYPAGHGVHAPAPARLYVPGGHRNTVALADPEGQA